ncbi:MAG TPA: Ig domain-containing protein, partial [Candidatus Limnocylindria bacterium]|nr:Ig domain-containing protein [Candidatus Limnocylindria bacterium]
SSYSQTISIEHSQSTVAFSVVSGTLPPGLSLNSSTGVISGIPTTVGTYAFTIQAADVSLTGKLVDQKDYTITIAAAQVAGGGGGGGILPPVTIPSPVLNPNPSSSLPGLMFPSSGQNSPQPISIITTTFPSNTLVLDNGTIYLIEHNTKIGFSSMKVFSGLGYKLKDVVKADSSSLPSSSYIFNNPSMEHAWGSWLIKNKTIYYSTEQGLIPIATWEIFLSNGGLSKYIVPMNVEDAKEAKLPIMEMGDGRVKP